MNYLENKNLYLHEGEFIIHKNICLYNTEHHSIKPINNFYRITNTIKMILISDIDYININSYSKYIITYNDNHIEESINNGIFPINFFIKNNIKKISFCCCEPSFLQYNLIFNKCNYAEIGVRYGASIEGILNYINENNIKCNINLFEHNINYVNLLHKKFDKYDFIKIYCGNGKDTLKLYNDNKFDIVFFDASHVYNTDKEILDSLIPHLNNNATIVFDDYYSSCDLTVGVNKLVDEFELKYKDKLNIIKQ